MLSAPQPGDLVRFKGMELMIEEIGEEVTILTDCLNTTVLVDTSALPATPTKESEQP